jgi:hypothetical protein
VEHLLQRLAAFLLLAAAPAAAQQKPFSHKQHLALKLTCAVCHQSAANSTKAADNNLPPAAACASCHTDGRAIPSQPTPHKLDHFNHQLHAKLGNIAPMIRAAIAGKTYLDTRTPAHLDTANSCAGCHHGIEQSENVKSASVFPHMGDCLICHNKVDPPFSCEKCHANPVSLKPANHTRNFIDRHNRNNEGLDRSGCFTCHGKQFSCMGCH